MDAEAMKVDISAKLVKRDVEGFSKEITSEDYQKLIKGAQEWAETSPAVANPVRDDAKLQAAYAALVRYDSDTLHKAYAAMVRSGLTDRQASDAINELLNAGILFRERV